MKPETPTKAELAAEVKRLIDALADIITVYEFTTELHTSHEDCAWHMAEKARAALRAHRKERGE